ncbi:zinc finger protein 75A-like isoform X2 [Ornithodoros turicata]
MRTNGAACAKLYLQAAGATCIKQVPEDDADLSVPGVHVTAGESFSDRLQDAIVTRNVAVKEELEDMLPSSHSDCEWQFDTDGFTAVLRNTSRVNRNDAIMNCNVPVKEEHKESPPSTESDANVQLAAEESSPVLHDAPIVDPNGEKTSMDPADEYPYKCKLCPASFKHLEDFERHEPSHSDERLYKCKRCPASFLAFAALQRHACNMHPAPDEPELCSYEFMLRNPADMTGTHVPVEEDGHAPWGKVPRVVELIASNGVCFSEMPFAFTP